VGTNRYVHPSQIFFGKIATARTSEQWLAMVAAGSYEVQVTIARKER
jgi:hypothetical protein